MIAKHSKSTRKTRTKFRKPKYLSLRLQLSATTPPPPPPTNHHDPTQLINLFPLHPENLVEEHDNMACIFSTCDDVDASATTLTGLLSSSSSDDDDDEQHHTNNIPSPSSVNYADEELVRTAMRKHKTDRNADDEKWVYYSEVVDNRKKMITEISSSSSTTTPASYHNNNNNHRSKLVLKLDYEKIINSWVNKGPLYIHNNSDPDAPLPQSVPDLHDDDFFLPSSINVIARDEQDNSGNGGLWAVPQMSHIENNGISGGDDALQAGESSPTAHNREASVQRYKEKRRNRLFAKTVRYEVRKLNAEKRPRIKGRFVKSS